MGKYVDLAYNVHNYMWKVLYLVQKFSRATYEYEYYSDFMKFLRFRTFGN